MVVIGGIRGLFSFEVRIEILGGRGWINRDMGCDCYRDLKYVLTSTTVSIMIFLGLYMMS